MWLSIQSGSAPIEREDMKLHLFVKGLDEIVDISEDLSRRSVSGSA